MWGILKLKKIFFVILTLMTKQTDNNLIYHREFYFCNNFKFVNTTAGALCVRSVAKHTSSKQPVNFRISLFQQYPG